MVALVVETMANILSVVSKWYLIDASGLVGHSYNEPRKHQLAGGPSQPVTQETADWRTRGSWLIYILFPRHGRKQNSKKFNQQ